MKNFFAALSALAIIGAFSSAAKADISIAAVGPLTGQYASFGQQIKDGAEMAVKDINAAGGILGQKIKLLTEDDACDPKQAVAVANKVAGSGVVFVAGHFCSGSSIPASKVYEEEGIVQISPASTNPKYTDEGGPNVFRVCGRDDQQGATAAAYIVKNFKDKRIAVLHDKTAYGKGLADQTKMAMEKLGKQADMYEAITAGEKDYTALVTKMKAVKIEYVYLGGYHTEAGLIIRQMRDQGMSATLISGDALVTNEFWSITGDAGEGTLMTFSPDPRKNPVAAPLVKRFRDAGIEPEGYVLYTYAAIQAWKLAAEKAGTVDPAKVTAALHSGAVFDTVLAKLSFDKKGDVTLPGYVFYKWSKGSYDYVK
ncbi:MAG: branched-chain amino acid ABC transporter substrate-binding protein [bacterium]|nr:branched-chain amino acid ABC transporter substrate-binding protein [bacterium]